MEPIGFQILCAQDSVSLYGMPFKRSRRPFWRICLSGNVMIAERQTKSLERLPVLFTNRPNWSFSNRSKSYRKQLTFNGFRRYSWRGQEGEGEQQGKGCDVGKTKVTTRKA